MRIYYIGQLWEGGTCLARMHELQVLGHEIVPFDVTPWASGGGRIIRSLAHRFNFGPYVKELNAALRAHSKIIGEMDVVWVDKGRWVYPETLNALRKYTKGYLFHYTPDSQIVFHKSRHFRRCIPLYDGMSTTKPFECEAYKNLGVKELFFVLQGHSLKFENYRPLTHRQSNCWESDVCFVGHFENHYANRIRAAGEITKNVKIWGNKWPEYEKNNVWASGFVKGSGAWGGDYLNALAHTKIALGLLSKWIPETTTTRSFEIPSIGTFMLAERTEDHLALFEEGEEAEFFGDDEEMKDKLRFYLANETARKKIAAAGRERCLRSGYGSMAQLKKITDQILLSKQGG